MNLPDKKDLPIKAEKELTGWGRFRSSPAQMVRPERLRNFKPVFDNQIVRGMGRSYGDSALNSEGGVILSTRLNRMLEFDVVQGVIKAEAGVSLADILATALPRGWFLPVTPGTKFCSLGGCLAADVHGKNHHHEGCFSAHVTEATLIVADGTRVTIGPNEHPELFWATAGGMGLTGMIVDVTLQLKKVENAYLEVTHRVAKNLEAMMGLLDNPEFDDEYTVAWIDCLAKNEELGRGIVMSGHHIAEAQLPLRYRWHRHSIPTEPKKKLPFTFADWMLSPTTVKLFNKMYFWYHGRRKKFITHAEKFFYPLDAIKNWPVMYGKNGFLQYQFVLPSETALDGMHHIIQAIADAGHASFLAVLKKFGPQGEGWMSFPHEGYTLALDIPVREGVIELLNELDLLVTRNGGRIYLAKDARMNSKHMVKMYPRLPEFRSYLDLADPEGRFASDQSRRLGIRSVRTVEASEAPQEEESHE